MDLLPCSLAAVSWFVNVVKGKGKVVTVLFLTEHHAMKAYWGVEV
jgi:hypothetical protein